MSRRIRIRRPPSTDNPDLNRWLGQLERAVNQLALGTAYGGLSGTSIAGGQDVGEGFSQLTGFDRVTRQVNVVSDITNSLLRYESDGTFLTTLHGSFGGTASADFELRLFHNGSETSFSGDHVINSNADFASSSLAGVLSISSGDTVAAFARRIDSTTTGTLTFRDGQILTHRLD